MANIFGSYLPILSVSNVTGYLVKTNQHRPISPMNPNNIEILLWESQVKKPSMSLLAYIRDWILEISSFGW